MTEHLRPLIGLTTSEMRERRRTNPDPKGDPPQREMALGIEYSVAIEKAGGLPIVLPPLGHEGIAPLLDQLAGLCLSGGPDLDPVAYDAEPHAELGVTERPLDEYELELIRAAENRRLPILGVCRGAQAMNVARGGTLHQHIAEKTGGSLEHRQTELGSKTTHEVEVEDWTRLADIVGAGSLPVNSFHHQAVDRLGHGLVVSARAPDGTVEAIEDPDSPSLFMGVQWHAEGLVDRAEQLALFEELVRQAARRRGLGAEQSGDRVA